MVFATLLSFVVQLKIQRKNAEWVGVSLGLSFLGIRSHKYKRFYFLLMLPKTQDKNAFLVLKIYFLRPYSIDCLVFSKVLQTSE